MEGEQPEGDSEPERAENDSESDNSEDEKRKKKVKKRKKKKKKGIKRAISAYMFFSKEVRPKIASESKLSFAEIAREVSRRWSELSPEEKQPYNELNEKDKIRYKEELANAPPQQESDSDSDEPKKKKKKRDPLLPKRPKTGFFFYLDETRNSIAEEFPDMKMSERSKLMGQRWSQLSNEEKKPFIEKNIIAKEEYKVAMEKYNQNKAKQAQQEGD